MDTTPKAIALLFGSLCFFSFPPYVPAAEAPIPDAKSKAPGAEFERKGRALVAELNSLVASGAQSTKIKIKNFLGGTYDAHLYARPADNSAVVISLERGQDPRDKDVEVPRIGNILVKGKPYSYANGGDFEYASAADEQTPFYIYFERGGMPAAMSKKTYWTKHGNLNQSIGVRDVTNASKPPRPSLNDPDWPCKDQSGNQIPKTVKPIDGDTIGFLMCANWGAPLKYVYEIRMTQGGVDTIEADDGIDPLIINHP